MLTCVTCPRSYCLKCIEEPYNVLERTRIWNNMSTRYAPIQCAICLLSGVDLGGFFSSDFATEDPKGDSGSQQKDTSSRERILEFIRVYKIKQEDVAKAINFSAGTLSLYLKGDTRRRGWGNLESKLLEYMENYEAESNSDQLQYNNNETNIRIAVPRDVNSGEECESPQQSEEDFNQLLNSHEYAMALHEILNDTGMGLSHDNSANYTSDYQFSPHWSYAEAPEDASNTNLVIHPPTSYSGAKADTDHNTDSMDDGSYTY